MTGESRLVRGGLIAAAAVVPVAAVIGFAFRRGPGALAGVAAIGLVIANFAVAGWTLTYAARRSAALFPAVAMPSFAFRMLGVLLAMKWIHGISVIDRTTFAITFGLGVATLLAY